MEGVKLKPSCFKCQVLTFKMSLMYEKISSEMGKNSCFNKGIFKILTDVRPHCCSYPLCVLLHSVINGCVELRQRGAG